MKQHLEIIQLLITVAALVGNAFHDFFSRILSIPRDGAAPSRVSALNRHADLAVGWTCCAVFTLTAGHSIAIAGRNPTVSFVPVASLSVGAVIVLYIVWFAWQGKRLERALWTLSLASIVVLLLGPGGPFNPIEYDRTGLLLGAPPSTPYEPPLPYWVALPVLVAIFVASYVAEYPRVLDFRRSLGPFVATISAVSLVALCMGSGAALVQDVLNDRSTPPRLNGGPAQWVRTSREQLAPAEMQTLYRKASEMTLARSYLSRFFTTIREVAENREKDLRGKSPDNAKELTPSAHEPDLALVRNQVRDLISSGFLFAQPEKKAFLETRLQWRHPISADGGKSGLPVPGIEPEQSLLNLARFVQRYAVAENEQNYGVVVKSPDAAQEQEDPASRLQADQAYHHAMRNVFPSISTFPGRTRLVQQLSLPLNYESAVAFNLYQQAAASSAGNADAAYQQLTIPPALLQALYEVPQRPDAERTLGLLSNVIECQGYSRVSPDLTLLTRNPVPFAEGLREIFLDHLDKDNSRLVELFVEIDANAKKTGSENTTSGSSHADTGTAAGLTHEGTKTVEETQREKAYNRASVFAGNLKSCLGKEEDVSRLFSAGGQAGPASQLLSPSLLQFVAYLGKDGKSPLERQQLVLKHLAALVNPIRAVWLEHASSPSDPSASDRVAPFLAQFDTFSEEEQRGALQHLAAGLYAIGGNYSPSVLGSIVGEAGRSSQFGGTIGLLLASVLVFPAFAVAIVAGIAGGRMLLDRSALLEQANREEAIAPQSTNLPESPTTFEGREGLLATLKAFSKRGWNTIALVGPRGIGKSEILKKLVQDGAETAIGIWLQAPTVFDDKVLASGVQHRIAEVIENRISSYLSLDQLPVRKLRSEAQLLSSKLFIAMSLAALSLATVAYLTVRRLDVSAIWMPVGVVGIFSLCAWVASGVLLQRPNLGVWLRRSSKSNPHLELLYDRCMLEIVGIDAATSRKLRWLKSMQTVALAVIPISLVAVSGPMWNVRLVAQGIFTEQVSIPTFAFEALVILGATAMFFGLMAYSRSLLTERKELSWTGAIEAYREFVRFCIERLDSGALGDQGPWRFMIAIDELDRITDTADLRTAIIRMRGLFEIKGVFYYLSMASDSLASLMTEDQRTKTEIDSAFDHIETVKGLGYVETRDLVMGYLSSRKVVVDAKVSAALALLSFGIPRDAIRYCDRALVICQRQTGETLTLHSLAKGMNIEYEATGETGFVRPKEKTEGATDERRTIRKRLMLLALKVADRAESLPEAIRDQLMDLGLSTWEKVTSEPELVAAVRELEMKCDKVTGQAAAVASRQR